MMEFRFSYVWVAKSGNIYALTPYFLLKSYRK